MDKKFSLALITGATSGIGERLSYLLAEKGINLVLLGRNAEKLKALEADLQKKVSVSTIAADLGTEDGVKKAVFAIAEAAPDLVINNAGLGYYGKAISHPIADQMEMLKVNGNAVLELTLEAAKALQAKGKKGTIMNVASVAAFHVMPYFAVYAAVKSFVYSFSLALGEELKSSGIRVLTSCPGVVITDFQARASKGKLKEVPMPMSMNADFAAEEIWRQIEEGKPVHLFDWRYRWLTWLSTLVPVSLKLKLSGKFFKR